jgi:hypothetical protein
MFKFAAASSKEHFDASMTEPPHVLHASRERDPPNTPLQSTINSAAATASNDAVMLQVHSIELLAEEYAPTAHAGNQRVPSYTTHPSVFRWPAALTTMRVS